MTDRVAAFKAIWSLILEHPAILETAEFRVVEIAGVRVEGRFEMADNTMIEVAKTDLWTAVRTGVVTYHDGGLHLINETIEVSGDNEDFDRMAVYAKLS